MQLKIKWVEINEPTLLSLHMPLQMSPWSCVMHELGRAKRKDGKLFPQYITDTL
jgi:hypothetical protein